MVQVFLPIMGPDCFAIYSVFRERAFSNPKLRHTVEELAETIDRGETTVTRALEILEHLGLVRLKRRGGSQASECTLLDSWDVARRFEAKYSHEVHKYVLPREVDEQLKQEIQAIRTRQQGKRPQDSPTHNGESTSSGTGRWSRSSLKRASSVAETYIIDSPEIRQRFSENRQRPTREMQMGTHLIRKEERSKERPTPTPSHSDEAQKDKDSPDEGETVPLLKWAQVVFTGVMGDMGNHLFDTSKKPVSHLANGFADWQEFGLNSLAVVSAAWHGEELVVVLSASDPAAAWRGLEKYHCTWNKSLRKWYKCNVHVELQQAQRKS